MANLQRGALMRGLQMSMPLAKAASRTTRPALFAAAAAAMLLGISGTAHAQAPTPKRTIVRAGRVLDVRTGQMRANQAIVIEGEKIAQIVAASEVKAAAGDATIDLPDATLLPGLIDAHTHLTFELSSLGYQGLAISTARCATRSMKATPSDLASLPRDRRWGSPADTAMKTCCRPRFTMEETELPTASRPCNTKFARSSNMARTSSRFALPAGCFRKAMITTLRSTRSKR